MKAVKWKVREVAEAAGIETASRLADVAEINKNTASVLWNGTSLRVDRETLRKLCEALNCTPGDLLEYAEVKQIASLVAVGA